MTYKIDFTSDKAERFFYDLYHAYQWSEDSFKDGDLKRNIINTAVFGETVKSLRLFGAVTECGNYNDNGFVRIGFAKVNGYTIVHNGKLDIMSLCKALEELAKPDRYLETRVMDWETLRTLCIKEQWCTRATNKEYEKLLGMTEHDYIDTDAIVEMANFIIAHSDEGQCDTDFESVCFKLLSRCQTFIREN